MTSPASIRFDPWALLIGIVVLGVAGIAFEHRESIGAALEPSEAAAPMTDVPDRLEDQPIEAMRTALGASRSFELEHEGAPLRAFVLPESGGDFSVALFRRSHAGYERFGAHTYAADFDPPELVGEPPRLQMRARRLGVVMVFVLREHDFELVPLDRAPALQ